jgi:Predicted periplasmic protein (DUF2271)
MNRITLSVIAAAAALAVPAVAEAKPVTLTAQISSYGGPGTYLALYVTDSSGNYKGSLWVSGTRTGYYRHLRNWARSASLSDINGITGASVGSGRTLQVTLDLKDTLFDAGYQLHIDAAAENVGESPNDVVVPLTTSGAGQSNAGQYFVRSFTYTM